MGPLSVRYQIKARLLILLLQTLYFIFISPPKFSATLSLFSLPSLRLLSHFIYFIPSELAPWWTLRDRSTIWDKHSVIEETISEAKLNLQQRVHTEPFVVIFSQVQYISLSLSIFHVHCLIWVVLIFVLLIFAGIILWMWKWVFLHGLMLMTLFVYTSNYLLYVTIEGQ